MKELLYLGFATFLLLPLIFGGSGVGGLLEHPILRWVGTVSYGLFLWHLTVIEVIADIQGPLWSTDTLLALTLAGGLALAAISWYAVERPAQHLADRISARLGRPAQPITSSGTQPEPASRVGPLVD